MKEFDLTILASDKPFFSGKCEALVLPTSNGEYGVLANHSNTIAAITPGMLKYRIPGGENFVASVSEGIIKIENGSVLVLVDTAEHPEEIDANAAKRQIDEAKEALLQKQSIADYQATRARMARALGRLKTKNYTMREPF